METRIPSHKEMEQWHELDKKLVLEFLICDLNKISNKNIKEYLNRKLKELEG